MKKTKERGERNLGGVVVASTGVLVSMDGECSDRAHVGGDVLSALSGLHVPVLLDGFIISIRTPKRKQYNERKEKEKEKDLDGLILRAGNESSALRGETGDDISMCSELVFAITSLSIPHNHQSRVTSTHDRSITDLHTLCNNIRSKVRFFFFFFEKNEPMGVL